VKRSGPRCFSLSKFSIHVLTRTVTKSPAKIIIDTSVRDAKLRRQGSGSPLTTFFRVFVFMSNPPPHPIQIENTFEVSALVINYVTVSVVAFVVKESSNNWKFHYKDGVKVKLSLCLIKHIMKTCPLLN
jgi:hypothetical protein